MKLVTFALPGGARHIGSVSTDGATISDFTQADAMLFRDMLTLIDGGEASLERARALDRKPAFQHAMADVQLLAPLPQPRRLRDALCFEKHFRQSKANRYLFGQGTARIEPAAVDIPAVWYDRPVYYKGNCFSVVGTGAEVHWPKRSRIVDFELEVALVTGRQGKDITENDALDHVFGYMVFNDFSARDLQYEEIHGSLGPAKGKDFDTGNAMGPWLVTADEVGDPQQLDMAVRVNGELWGSGNSSEMHHGFRRLVSYASQDETLYPGEVLGSGTLGGGCGNERGRFLQHDDVVEMTVQGLGTLRNRIVAPHIPQPPALPIAIFPASMQPAAA